MANKLSTVSQILQNQTESPDFGQAIPTQVKYDLSEQQVVDFLAKCGIAQYTDVFLSEGFDQVSSILDVTEQDLIAMGVKRGHRRLLQREVATMKGVPVTTPLAVDHGIHNGSPAQSSSDAGANSTAGPRHVSSTSSGLGFSQTSGSVSGGSSNFRGTSTSLSGRRNSSLPSTEDDNGMSGMSDTRSDHKRKYRRHAKPDKNAPVKPPSAYVMFSNRVRAELKDHNMSFTDLAKIVGDRWNAISAEEKAEYEMIAARAKEDYLSALIDYEQTDEYKNYHQYLSDFKSKHEAAARPVGKPRKRAKAESPSSGSMADSSSYGNGNGNGNSSSGSNGNGNGNGSGNGHFNMDSKGYGTSYMKRRDSSQGSPRVSPQADSPNVHTPNYVQNQHNFIVNRQPGQYVSSSSSSSSNHHFHYRPYYGRLSGYPEPYQPSLRSYSNRLPAPSVSPSADASISSMSSTPVSTPQFQPGPVPEEKSEASADNQDDQTTIPPPYSPRSGRRTRSSARLGHSQDRDVIMASASPATEPQNPTGRTLRSASHDASSGARNDIQSQKDHDT